MTVLDASAVLALVHDEPGAEIVAQALASAAEVLTADHAWVDLDLPIRVRLLR